MRWLLVLLVSGLSSALWGCGGAPPKPSTPPKVASAPKPPARPAHTLYRDEVERVVDGGLGRFLGHLELVESLDKDGKFVGFRIVRLMPEKAWEGVDLLPGDVVTRVNGMPIERETQAYEAFQSLRSAKQLAVDYLRDGAPRVLSYRIIERPQG